MKRMLSSLVVLAALLLALVPPLAAAADGCMDKPCCTRMPCPEGPQRAVERASCCGSGDVPALPASSRGETLLPTGVKLLSTSAAFDLAPPAPAATHDAVHASGETITPRVGLYTLHATFLI